MSLRRRMLVILLSAFFLVWMLATGYTILNARHRIAEGVDNQLVQAANYLWLRAKRSHDEDEDIADAMRDMMRGLGRLQSLQFQIWEGETQLMRSPDAPEHRMSSRPGLSSGQLHDAHWRIFYRVDAVEGLDVIVALEDDFSGDVAKIIAFNTTWPILLALPFVGIAIFFGVNKGLAPLRQLEAQITQRSPTQMAPIDASSVPSEVKGIVTSLNALLERLEQAIESERRFTANASHELRTPLAAIDMQAQVALKAKNEEERDRALHQIGSSVNRATRLISQLLTLARLDPEYTEDLLKPTNLKEIVQHELASIAGEVHEKGIEIELEAPDRVMIMGDADSLSIMVRNLMDNAVRYSSAGGKVTAVLHSDTDGTRLIVKDTGVGIPEGQRQKVFDRFYRMVGSASTGAGLGLSIVKRIVDVHEAQISLGERNNKKGLAVAIFFPKNIT